MSVFAQLTRQNDLSFLRVLREEREGGGQRYLSVTTPPHDAIMRQEQLTDVQIVLYTLHILKGIHLDDTF